MHSGFAMLCEQLGLKARIPVAAFCGHARVKRTAFMENVFAILDEDDVGQPLDFRVFSISLWNLASLNEEYTPNLARFLYHVTAATAETDTLSRGAIRAMVQDLHGLEDGESDPRLEQLYDHWSLGVDDDQAVSMTQFVTMSETHRFLTFPVYRIQREVRAMFLGPAFWDDLRMRRIRKFHSIVDIWTMLDDEFDPTLFSDIDVGTAMVQVPDKLRGLCSNSDYSLYQSSHMYADKMILKMKKRAEKEARLNTIHSSTSKTRCAAEPQQGASLEAERSNPPRRKRNKHLLRGYVSLGGSFDMFLPIDTVSTVSSYCSSKLPALLQQHRK